MRKLFYYLVPPVLWILMPLFGFAAFITLILNLVILSFAISDQKLTLKHKLLVTVWMIVSFGLVVVLLNRV